MPMDELEEAKKTIDQQKLAMESMQQQIDMGQSLLGRFDWRWQPDTKRYSEGIDPKGIVEKLTRYDEMLAADPKGDAEKAAEERYSAKEHALTEAHTAALTTLKGEYDGVYGQLESRIGSDEALKELFSQCGDSANLMLPHVLPKLVIKPGPDGKLAAFVRDPNNSETVRYSAKGGTTSPMSIGELVTELGEDAQFKLLYNSKQKPGSGELRKGADVVVTEDGIDSEDAAAINANLKGLADGTVELRPTAN